MAERVTTYITNGVGCVCALGNDVHTSITQLINNESGIQKVQYGNFPDELALGKIVANFQKENEEFSWFEQIIFKSTDEALAKVAIDVKSARTLFILSTTKGNIGLIEEDEERSLLNSSADKVKEYYDMHHKPLIISVACISGVAALVWAHNLIQQNKYDHIVVCGADVLSPFVTSGFLSFKALSPEVCKPYDMSRVGLNLGEAAATIILSSKIKGDYKVVEGATANDANHISGPSRTGEGLVRAIKKTLGNQLPTFISAHGTATPFNDAMEVQAFVRLGLGEIPTNSLKAYIGHTLGAAGVIETLLSVKAAKKDMLIKSLGFENSDEETPLNIITENQHTSVNSILKTASGFGGSNAAILIEKVND